MFLEINVQCLSAVPPAAVLSWQQHSAAYALQKFAIMKYSDPSCLSVGCTSYDQRCAGLHCDDCVADQSDCRTTDHSLHLPADESPPPAALGCYQTLHTPLQ